MTTTDTREKADTLVDKIAPYVRRVLLAQAIAETERERVDAIQRRVLKDQAFFGRDTHDRKVRITEPKYDWMMDDFSANQYYAKLNAIHVQNGFEDAAKGYCPALVAEETQRRAERELIAAAEWFFPGVTIDRLLCGTKDLGGLETHRKYLDLLIGLVVNHPSFRHPLTNKPV